MDFYSSLLITRKPEDETHGNHLRAPSFGIRDLRLKAAGKSSVFHLPENAPDPATAETGSDSFNFLPEYDVCELAFVIDNPYDIVDRARIEITTPFDTTPAWTIDLVKLGATWIRHGQHTVKWPGQLFADTAEIPGTIKGEATEHDVSDLAAHPPVPNTAADASLASGWLTLEHAAYRLRLVLESDTLPGNPAEAWTYFQILVKKLEISLGPERMVPKIGTDERLARDKAIRQAIATDGGSPAPGAAARKVVLMHNVFKMTGNDMYPNIAGKAVTAPGDISVEGNDPFFRESAALWGDGPVIPLVCKIWLSEAANGGTGIDVSAPAAKGSVALGRARFLWEWEDPPESMAGQSLKPAAFLPAAIDFDKAKTGPKGDNCHGERGGKRGPLVRPVFPYQPGTPPKDPVDDATCPFPVAQATEAALATVPPAPPPPRDDPRIRVWGSFSLPWTSGAMKGQTGVIFCPSRMAGDDYIVRVTLANERDAANHVRMDNATQPLAVVPRITATTGPWQVRRKLKIARYIRKQATISDFLSAANLTAIRTAFDGPYTDVEPPDGAEKYLVSEQTDASGTPIVYNTVAGAALTASGDVRLTGNIAIATGADHGASESAFETRDYKDFVQALHLALNPAVPAAATDFATYAAANATTADALAASLATAALAGASPVVTRLTATKTWLATNACTTPNAYCSSVNNWLGGPCSALVNSLCTISGGKATRPAAGGVTILEFNQNHAAGRRLMASGGGGYLRVVGMAVDVTDHRRDACCFLFYQQDVNTFCHEVGHHLCLPHSNFGTPGNMPGGAEPSLHDADDSMCLMTYSNGTSVFCGFCQLRLRGWAAKALSSNDASNTRT